MKLANKLLNATVVITILGVLTLTIAMHSDEKLYSKEKIELEAAKINYLNQGE